MMRLFLKIVAGLVVVGLLGVAVLVVPALVQVWSIEPPLPDEDDLRALLKVDGGPVGLRYANTSSQELFGRTLGHTVFLAEWPSGDLFMIDTGMDELQALEFGELMQTMAGGGPAEPHGSIADLIGPAVERVMGVAYTHLHIDHSQGTIPFCEARGEGASVYQTSWQATEHNYNTTEGAAIVADSCLEPGRLSAERIQTTPRFPGLGIVALGGHTPGSTLFALPVDGHLWIFSGDITNSKRDLVENNGKQWYYSYLMVPENTARNEALRIWLAGLDRNPDMTVVVSHDLIDIETTGLSAWGAN